MTIFSGTITQNVRLTGISPSISVRPVGFAPEVVYISNLISPTPRVRVTSPTGAPVSGVRVVLRILTSSEKLPVAAPYIIKTRASLSVKSQYRFTTLTGDIAFTDSDGVASFSEAAVTGTTSRSVIFEFVAGGKLALWNKVIDLAEHRVIFDTLVSPSPSSDGVYSLRSSFQFDAANPAVTTVVEGSTLIPFVVSVLLAANSSAPLPAKGRRVIARAVPTVVPNDPDASASSDFERTQIQQRRRLPLIEFKELRNAVSSSADTIGLALFEKLQFSVDGNAGYYYIQFTCAAACLK